MSRLRLFLVKRNRKDGSGSFWGCSAWKPGGGCSFVRDDKSVPRPVSWKDSFSWGRLKSLYLTIGSAPGFLDLKNIEKLRAAPSKTLMISRIERSQSDSPYISVCHGVGKMLLRGEYAFPGFAVEKELLKTLPAEHRPKALKASDPEIGYEELAEVNPQAVTQCIADRHAGIAQGLTTGHLTFDSEREAIFFTKWIPQALGTNASVWFTPQAPLDMLLNALAKQASHYGVQILCFMSQDITH